MLQEISEFGVLSEEVTAHPELLELLLPVLRADCTAHETYVYQEEAPFNFPIWVYGGFGDSSLNFGS